MSVLSVYVTKKPQFSGEDEQLLLDIKQSLAINSIESLKIYNRYFVEGLEQQDFEKCVETVLSEPQVDDVFYALDTKNENVFAVEYLPGQYDQRADSAEQCIQFVLGGERVAVRPAKMYILQGKITEQQKNSIINHIINPVEARLASLQVPTTLCLETPEQRPPRVIKGFINFTENQLAELQKEYGFAMDSEDLLCCKHYFAAQEKRDPTETELRMIDTYWSDHCRHTTFLTQLTDINIQDKEVKQSFDRYKSIREQLYNGKTKPITLMDIATVGAKYLSSQGLLESLDLSQEINACSVKIDADIDGKTQKYLLMFKNETHNHPTEIEPFGGAATCLGGAIRDPLSGRSYVYQAMRITGAANPLTPLNETKAGKLPQIKICRTAAAGYSSYGNQIGLATGLVDEIYHEGYVAKRMEVGAVIGAVPIENVVRETPNENDVIVLLGGATGRDGCGGATGSSKSHSEQSLESCGAEVQKGNAPEERKIQRLFRNGEVTKLIKRCNDFGAGGVAVAIGELADGLCINLDKVPLKYEGLSATEIAISESQERMAVVLHKNDLEKFIQEAAKENLNAVQVATVTKEKRLVMGFQDEIIVNLSREFLNSNGSEKQNSVFVQAPKIKAVQNTKAFKERFIDTIKSLNVASKKGLVERFDSTVGAATVLMPYGGKYGSSKTQVMAAKLPVMGNTTTCSLMSYGFDPYETSENCYKGAYLSVVSSVARLVAAGGSRQKMWLSFQEYFGRLNKDEKRWGKPFAALLGALDAQIALRVAAIGGKDSMSGSFGELDVPPTLISFAVSLAAVENIISPEFKGENNAVYIIKPQKTDDVQAQQNEFIQLLDKIEQHIQSKKIISAYSLGIGAIAEAISVMSFGNRIGLQLNGQLSEDEYFEKNYFAFVVETAQPIDIGVQIGVTTKEPVIATPFELLDIMQLQAANNSTLEPVYKTKTDTEIKTYEKISHNKKCPIRRAVSIAKPRVLIPVFPGTNCEYDTAKAFISSGGEAEILVIKNRSASDINESIKALQKAIKSCQIIAIPGGFSGGDEPDGSAKFITSFFRNQRISEAVHQLLYQNDGLMCGICNGFQALIKLGLLPYGRITTPKANSPTLTFNSIARHQSALVRTRVCSTLSPWLMHHGVGDINIVPISHGEGRFIADPEQLAEMIQNGQVATQYVDLNGEPTSDIEYNKNNSVLAIEGITSKDGRIFGKMAHSERYNENLYKNVPNVTQQQIFKGAIDYYK